MFLPWANSKARVKAIISTFCRGIGGLWLWLYHLMAGHDGISCMPSAIFKTYLLLSVNQFFAFSIGASFRSRWLEYIASIVSSHGALTSCVSTRKEAGLIMLVTTVSTLSCSPIKAWYFRNLCGESQCLPFTSNTADTIWDPSTVIFSPKVNFCASWMFTTMAASILAIFLQSCPIV